MTHGRWARLFIRSLKSTLHRLLHSDVMGFEAIKFNPFSTSKKRWSRRYAQNNGDPAGTSYKSSGPKKRRAFNFGLEATKTSKNIIRTDDEASKKHWKKCSS